MVILSPIELILKIGYHTAILWVGFIPLHPWCSGWVAGTFCFSGEFEG